MADISIARHISIFDPSKLEQTIHIIGCGATGSRLFGALVELGCMNIECYDFDVVEPHNLANQLFLSKHIGMKKVDALADWYEAKTGEKHPNTMVFHDRKVTGEDRKDFEGIVCMLVDTIEGRKDIYNGVIKANTFVDLVVETRMGSSHGDVFTFEPFNEKQSVAWLDSIPEDGEAELSPCGTPLSVGVTASLIANLAAWQIINWANHNRSHQSIEYSGQRVRGFFSNLMFGVEDL